MARPVVREKQVTIPHQLTPDDALYFLHIPKTAGISFRKVLQRRFEPTEIYRAYKPRQVYSAPPGSLDHYRLYSSHLGYTLAEFVSKPLIFLTLLREPVSRTVSMYHFVRNLGKHPLHSLVKGENLSLDDFVRHPQCVPFLREHQTFILAYKDHAWSSQRLDSFMKRSDDALTGTARHDGFAEFAERRPRMLVELACRRLDAMAFVGIVERMDESVDLLAKTFCWDQMGRIPMINVTPKEEKKAVTLSPATRAVIEDLTRLDTQVYDYACQLFEKRKRQLSEGNGGSFRINRAA